ncbi:hypothetical protein Esti_004659 [Eimeria stiedai]
MSDFSQAARACSCGTAARDAAKRLMECGEKSAEDFQREGRLDQAVEIRRGCLDLAKLSGDEGLHWNALHSLGLSLKEVGNGMEAVEVQTECLSLAKQLSNKARECRARAALAAALLATKRDKEAVKEFETLLEIATQTANASIQSQACAFLSELYQRNGKEERAVELCQRHFDFARIHSHPHMSISKSCLIRSLLCLTCSKSGDMESLEAARASLGLAKARLRLPYLRRMVCSDLQELAKWKCALR